MDIKHREQHPRDREPVTKVNSFINQLSGKLSVKMAPVRLQTNEIYIPRSAVFSTHGKTVVEIQKGISPILASRV